MKSSSRLYRVKWSLIGLKDQYLFVSVSYNICMPFEKLEYKTMNQITSQSIYFWKK